MDKTNASNYINLYDGKYGVINHNGRLEIFRHGERWVDKEINYIGDGFALALVHKIEELEENNKKLIESINYMINIATREGYEEDFEDVLKELKKLGYEFNNFEMVQELIEKRKKGSTRI